MDLPLAEPVTLSQEKHTLDSLLKMEQELRHVKKSYKWLKAIHLKNIVLEKGTTTKLMYVQDAFAVNI
jgi:hypothetical protein